MTIKKRFTLIAAVLSVLIAATACAAPAVSTGSAETDTKAVESIEDASEEETEEASADEEAAEEGEEAKDADASEAADKEDAEEAAAGKSADDSTKTVASGEKTRTAVNRKRAFGPEKDPLDVRPTEEPASQAAPNEIVMPQEEVLPAGTGDSSANSIAVV